MDKFLYVQNNALPRRSVALYSLVALAYTNVVREDMMQKVSVKLLVSFDCWVEQHEVVLTWRELRGWLNSQCKGWNDALYTLPDGRTGSIRYA